MYADDLEIKKDETNFKEPCLWHPDSIPIVKKLLEYLEKNPYSPLHKFSKIIISERISKKGSPFYYYYKGIGSCTSGEWLNGSVIKKIKLEGTDRYFAIVSSNKVIKKCAGVNGRFTKADNFFFLTNTDMGYKINMYTPKKI